MAYSSTAVAVSSLGCALKAVTWDAGPVSTFSPCAVTARTKVVVPGGRVDGRVGKEVAGEVGRDAVGRIGGELGIGAAVDVVGGVGQIVTLPPQVDARGADGGCVEFAEVARERIDRRDHRG